MATKKRNNTWIYVLIGAVALLVVVAVVKGKSKPKGESVQTEKVETRTIKETVEASGKVFPTTEVKISSDVSGEVVELFVKEGDSVRAGQILARVDPEAYVSQVERAQAGVNSAKSGVSTSRAQIETSNAQAEQIEAQLVNAREIHKRNEKLKADGVIAQADYEASFATVKQLEANLRAAQASIRSATENVRASEFQVKSAEASMKEINTSLKRTTIYSTMSGIVSKLNIEKGERVVGTSMMAGTEILRIADLKVMEVQVEVTENDLPRIALGQMADIEIDAYLDRKFKGKVVEIAHTANNLVGNTGTGVVSLTTDQVTNFVVTIDIDPASYADLVKPGKRYPFRPGMSASVEILTKTVENVVAVPIQSVGTRDRDKKKDGESEAKVVKQEGSATSLDEDVKEVVFLLLPGDSVTMVEVSTGVQDDDYIEILSGVKAGDEVVKGPYTAVSRKLKQGSKVTKDNDKKKDDKDKEEDEEED